MRRGRVVAIPTDALYTLVADPFNLRAVSRVFAAKGREIHRSLPLLIGDIDRGRRSGRRADNALLPAGAAFLARAR